MSRRLAAPALTAILALATVAGCVFGFRGEVEFAGDASLAGIDTVQLHLPATELILAGDPTRSTIEWRGTWSTLGGSANDALAGGNRADLRWERWEQLGRLSADLPLDLRDITSLDELTVESASNRAHEIVGTGEVFIAGIDDYISVDLAGGNIEVIGGVTQLALDTERGNITVDTDAGVVARTGLGRVEIQSTSPRDLLVTARGPVSIALAESASLDIDIAEAGQILVDLDSAAHVGSGSYRRVVGLGAVTIRVRSAGGSVDLHAIAQQP